MLESYLTMMRSLRIGKRSDDYVIYKKDPFAAEKFRQMLASQGDFIKLKKTYKDTFKEIVDVNSKKFWDKNLNKAGFLSKQDGMTKARIKATFNIIPKNAYKILDIGIGLGYIEELLTSRKGVGLCGNDISERAIKNAKKKFEGEFKLESWEEMSFPESKFDVILLLEVLEHVPPSKTFQLLGKIKKYLGENGTFVLSIPVNEELESMNDNPNGHLRIYTEDLIKAELKIAGFKVVSVMNFYAFEKYYEFKKILSKIFRNRWKPNVLVLSARKM